MTSASMAVEEFRQRFGAEPDGVWEAPGRVNLIGEHTDYNDGLVLPIALPQRTYVAARRIESPTVHFSSVGMATTQPVPVEEIIYGNPSTWDRYPAGVVWALRTYGHQIEGGIEASFASDVPVGSGLSSSAAIEGAIASAISDLWNLGLLATDEGRLELASLCQQAENVIAGAPTGGMDQAASLRSRQGFALYLDCADHSVQHVPFNLHDHGLALLVINTNAPHSHSTGEYGRRREDCHQACTELGIRSLREITIDDLDEVLHHLSTDQLRQRVRHVVTEINRVRLAVQAMEADDFSELGRLFVDSHASMRDDYEISCPELDLAVLTCLEAGALGARMTGGGFGGSAIALIFENSMDDTQQAITQAYARRGFIAPDFLIAHAGLPARRSEY